MVAGNKTNYRGTIDGLYFVVKDEKVKETETEVKKCLRKINDQISTLKNS